MISTRENQSLVFSGRYHIISNALIVNNCIILCTGGSRGGSEIPLFPLKPYESIFNGIFNFEGKKLKKMTKLIPFLTQSPFREILDPKSGSEILDPVLLSYYIGLHDVKN